MFYAATCRLALATRQCHRTLATRHVHPTLATRQRHRVQRRRGAIVVLMACLLVVLVAMVAFALDVGYICSVKAELQNAADAAALAGAHQAMRAVILKDEDTAAVAASTIAAADDAAKQFALVNSAGGVSVAVPSTDIKVGYQATPGLFPVESWRSGQPVPNCVQVTTRRDTIANGSLPLIFGPVLGTTHSNPTATATAAFDPGRYSVTGFKSNRHGPNAKILPIAISIQTWTEFIKTGLSPDGARYDEYSVPTTLDNSTTQPPHNVGHSADDTPELVGAYPSKTMPGNFGLVQLNPKSSQGRGNYSNWIRNGASPSDLASFGSDGIQATPSTPVTLEAGTGLKSSLISDLAAIQGEPRAIPLYSSYAGSGNGGKYTIVGFAGVTIVNATGSGSNINVAFQPAIVIDPTATTGKNSSGKSSSNVTQFVYPQVPVMLVR